MVRLLVVQNGIMGLTVDSTGVWKAAVYMTRGAQSLGVFPYCVKQDERGIVNVQAETAVNVNV